MEKGDIMDAVKCEAFLTAVDRGSFTAAAETLGYTQSGITRMIGALETELGFPLFVRQKKGVVLTENGKTMLPAIRDFVRSNRRAEEMGLDIQGVVKGTLTIGSYFSVSSMWMPSILKKFEEKYPMIKIYVIEGGNKELTRRLNEKSVDLCFCGEPSKSANCDWIPLYKDRMVAWLPPDHPKASNKTFKISDLEKYPFIHTFPNQDSDQDRLIESENLILNERYSTKDAFTTYNMVEAGLGISFEQQLISRKWRGNINVAEVPLSPARYVNIGLAVPSLKDASPVAKRFIERVKDIFIHDVL